MSTLSRHHKELTNGVGKCSVPMWSGGTPDGFCNQKAYGERPRCQEINYGNGQVWRTDGKYSGYVPALACPCHGGPTEPVIIYEQDGNMICAHYTDFTNPMENLCGFGKTKEIALEDLLKNEAEDVV